MLSIISNQKFSPIPANQSISRDEYDKRRETIERFATDLKTQAQLDKIKDVTICRIQDLFELTPRAVTSSRIIYTPPLLYLIPSDFGSELKGITSLQEFDQKASDDPLFLQRLSDRLHQIFRQSPTSITQEQREYLRLMIRYITEDSKLAKQGMRFVMLHELGHLYHQHSTYKQRWINITGVAFGALGMMTGLTYRASYTDMIFLLILAVVATKAMERIAKILHSRNSETEADLVAISKLKKGKKVREGGIYLFNILRKHQISLRQSPHLPFKERVLFKLAFTPKGNNRFLYFTHPSETERIQNIKNFDRLKKTQGL